MSPLDILFQRADKAWEAGDLKSAFRLFLRAAKKGDICCQVNLGTFYCDGPGVRPDRDKALYWYRRASRRGHRAAAAATRFESEITLGEIAANLKLPKAHLKRSENKNAIRHLQRFVKTRPNPERACP